MLSPFIMVLSYNLTQLSIIINTQETEAQRG